MTPTMTQRAAKRTRRSILAVAIAVALVGAFIASDSATAQDKPKKDKKEAIRYSHDAHAKIGVKHERCQNCHVLDEKYIVLAPTLGKNHQPCNDSECHATEYFMRKPTICVVCHTDTQPWVKQTASLRQQSGTSEFGGDLSHKTHATARVGGSGANGACKKCHGDVFKGTPSRGGHDDCAPCHAKKNKPAMGDCGGCHRLGARKARMASKSSDWNVAALFAHNTHGTDPRADGETECTTCHQTIPAATKLAEIENPAMKSCDACHDGKAAFKTTGFECYRCHGQKVP